MAKGKRLVRGALKAISQQSNEAKMAVGAAKMVYKAIGQLKKKKRTRAKSGRGGGVKQISAPLATQVQTTFAPLAISQNGDIKTVSGTETLFTQGLGSGYAIQEFLVNPVEPYWPNLAAESTMYQMYRITGMELVFESLCPTTTQGVTIIGQVTDPVDSGPQEYEDVATYPRSVVNPVWSNFSWKPTLDNQWRYINGSDATEAEQRQLYAFKIFIARYSSGAAAVEAGTYRIRYTMQLAKRIPAEDPSQLYVDAAFPVGVVGLTLKRRSWFSFADNKLVFRARGTYQVSAYIQNFDDIAVGGVTTENLQVMNTLAEFSRSGLSVNNNVLFATATVKTLTGKIGSITLPLSLCDRRLVIMVQRI